MECSRVARLALHAEKVRQLLLNCPDIVTISVGPSQKELTCHKALLGFTSEFFDAALYGNFKESQTNIIPLPEENPNVVAGFLTWAYTGHIESSSTAEELWVFGDRIASPRFMNEAMHLIFAIYGRHERWLSAKGAFVAYNHSAPISKLRSFVENYVDIHGPLCEEAINSEAFHLGNHEYERDWQALIEEGGKLTVDIALGNGVRHQGFAWDEDCVPPRLGFEQWVYMVRVTTRVVEDFIQGKMRGVRE
ncbi:hypothetical protein ONS95_009473 [Cadophora gregata]|uniref:uncharacterized protein n=1 Tax=Cadophora gregata TaxID=51156 RepID=UPI0026DA9CCB|nr:uncharacterized protein ONS95_009473 [Cadophora gregata]KAK0124524.1 hypothetical protein ONS95_009473 [Cadophora gregata]KAK0129624.1 hypothetical protein ONS96_000188 [Cadophora gregata f. sp. sojae]